MQKRKNIAILGSTGSIGTQTLDVISEYPDRLYPYLLTANRNSGLLISQALRYKPHKVVIADPSLYTEVRDALSGTGIEVAAGMDAITEAVTDTNIEIVVTALVGYSGLAPTISAINAGKKIALANKETLVVAGELITTMLKDSESEVIPVDSEHSAIFQCLIGEDKKSVEQLILTASGGPFRTKSPADMENVTKEDIQKAGEIMNEKIAEVMGVLEATTGMSKEAILENFAKVISLPLIAALKKTILLSRYINRRRSSLRILFSKTFSALATSAFICFIYFKYHTEAEVIRRNAKSCGVATCTFFLRANCKKSATTSLAKGAIVMTRSPFTMIPNGTVE